MNDTMYSHSISPTDQATLDFLGADYDDLRKELLAAKLSAEVVEELPSLTSKEKRQIHNLLNQPGAKPRVENQIHGIMGNTNEADQRNGHTGNIMTEITSTPIEAPALFGPAGKAYEDAMSVAQPSLGNAGVQASVRGNFSPDMIDTERLEPNKPYNQRAVERDVQIQLAKADGSPHDGFADIFTAIGQTPPAVPMSPEVQQYANQQARGQTTGAHERFGPMAPQVSIAELEQATKGAETVSERLTRWSVTIDTTRKAHIGAEPDTITLPPGWS